MKTLIILMASFVSMSTCSMAGQSALARVSQPFMGMDSGGISIELVICLDWDAANGLPSGIGLISAPYIPPTNAPRAGEDVNLASLCHLSFDGRDPDFDKIPGPSMDATKFTVDSNLGLAPEEVLRASLECLRRMLPKKLKSAPLIFTAQDKDREWIGKIVAEFNTQDREEPFYTPPNR